MKKTPPKSIDRYIEGFPKEVQIILKKIRETIRKVRGQRNGKLSDTNV
jgi:hypothetical protein